MDRRRTEIAGRNVPVESGEIITIDFSGGPQPGDAGPKDFWVIFNERDAYIARWRHGEDPGERFRIMENEKGYEEHTSELQSRLHLVCRLLLEKKKNK